MNMKHDPTDPQCPCDCCDDSSITTPIVAGSPPSLSHIAYRCGAHASFKATLLRGISASENLRDLTTRSDDDLTIAYLDASAMVLDVLAFYQERIANENYLRTATRRRSVLELAATLGYSPRPGVAAETALAFTMESAAGTPNSVRLEIGTKVQSQPGQDELPEVFETITEIVARPDWNTMKPLLKEWITPQPGETVLYLDGISTQLKPGHSLLIVDQARESSASSEAWEFRRIIAVEPDNSGGWTRVILATKAVTDEQKEPLTYHQVKVFALRKQTALLGYNDLVYDETGSAPPRPKTASEHENLANPVHLDAVYPEIAADSWVVLEKPGYSELYHVTEALETIEATNNTTLRTTRLELSGEKLLFFTPGNTTLHGQSEELTLLPQPIADAVEEEIVVLDEEYPTLETGRLLAFSGIDADTREQVAEVVALVEMSLLTIPDADGERFVSQLWIEAPLQYRYKRDSLIINGNVAEATHGESTFEILGSGDARESFQTFPLKKPPLTYIPATTPSGGAPAIEIRVDNILWEPRDTLSESAPTEEVYRLFQDARGNTHVQFGDGIKGARLPTGVNNITAHYRAGLGTNGNLEAGKLTLLLSRPPGLKSVLNPQPAIGAEDSETLDHARQNAPASVLTLGRVVSLRDFEHFAGEFSGIGKAQAGWVQAGEERLVHLTLAGNEGETVGEEKIADLLEAIDQVRDPYLPVTAHPCEYRYFQISAGLMIEERYDEKSVLESAEVALLSAFAFLNREFAQSVAAGEIIAVLQEIEGVEAVDLDRFMFRPLMSGVEPSNIPAMLVSHPARPAPSGALPAQLLLIDSEENEGIDLYPL